jgi:TatD DNase family protein
MWFDSHCHLHTVAEREPLDEVLRRARGALVNDVLSLGLDAETSQQVRDLTVNEGVWAGAAFHPSETKGWQDSWIEPIDRLLEDPKVVAVGETGIDHYWDRDFDLDQEAAFRAHIQMSKKHDKALVIHTRDSLDVTLAIVDDAGPPERLVFHCWSGDDDQLHRALELGSYISFAGNSTFKKNATLRELAAAVPSDRILIETDSPYLTPEPHRGKSNEPAFVAHVGAALAEVRGEEVAAFAEMTTQNARTLFGL